MIQNDETDLGIPFPIIVFIGIYIVFRIIRNEEVVSWLAVGGRRGGSPIFFPVRLEEEAVDSVEVDLAEAVSEVEVVAPGAAAERAEAGNLK